MLTNYYFLGGLVYFECVVWVKLAVLWGVCFVLFVSLLSLFCRYCVVILVICGL